MKHPFLFALALSLAPVGPLSHAPAAAQTPGTLPDAYAGLSPAQARELRDTIVRLTQQRDVREATLTRIAERLRVSLGDTSFGELIDLVEIRAGEAETLRTELTRLRNEFEAISERAERDPAQDLLERASAAFDAGDLAQADALLAELAPIRAENLRISLENWEDVVAARAQIMVIDGRVVESVRYRRQASRAIAEQARQARFELMLQAANDAATEGERLPGFDLLQLAVETLQEDVLPLAPRDTAPDDWAETQNNLGIVLNELGERSGDEATLQRAVDAYDAALTVFTPDVAPVDWAMTQNNLGIVLKELGERSGDEATLQRAVDAYDAALTVYTPDAAPVDWAMTQNNLGIVLKELGERSGDEATLQRAVDAYDAALTVYTPDATPVAWASVQSDLGVVLRVLGQQRSDEATLQRAVDAYDAALTVRTPDAAPVDWAATQVNLGNVLVVLGQRSGDEATLQRAVEAHEAALAMFEAVGHTAYAEIAQRNRDRAQAALDRLRGG